MKRQTQRVKTVTRTFRLDKILTKMLEEEAAKEKITVNSLVSRMLWNYQKRCQYCLHYNLMLVDPTVFKAMLENMSDEAVEKLGSSLGPSVMKENLARLGMSPAEGSVEFIVVEALGQWTKWYDADVGQTSNGRVYYLHHILGKKWSIFLKNFFEQAMAQLLNLNLKIETTENSIIFTTPKPAQSFNKIEH